MNSTIVPFDFDGQSVRVVKIDGEPWFVLNDVALILDLANMHSSLASLDDDERGLHTMETPGGHQPRSVISESGLYSLILRSRKPEAKGFKRWVTRDVLPEIRKTGSYGTAPALTGPELMARALIEAQATLTAQTERIAELEPAAEAWQVLGDAAGDLSLRDAAQILARDHGITTGQNRLMDSLRDWGWVDGKDVPYQRVVDQGLLRQRPRYYEHARTNVRVLAKPQIRITTKGLERVLARVKEAS